MVSDNLFEQIQKEWMYSAGFHFHLAGLAYLQDISYGLDACYKLKILCCFSLMYCNNYLDFTVGMRKAGHMQKMELKEVHR